jgi:hypothetical protein
MSAKKGVKKNHFTDNDRLRGSPHRNYRAHKARRAAEMAINAFGTSMKGDCRTAWMRYLKIRGAYIPNGYSHAQNGDVKQCRPKTMATKKTALPLWPA